MKDYKKILEGVIDIISTTEKSDIGFANICTYIGENCPELKESEDEKISREITEFLVDFNNGEYERPNENTIDSWLSWLEKQGEQKPAGNVEPKFKKGDRVIGIISGMQYYITEVCNDYYYTESGCIIMFCAQDNFNLYEQNSAWSEEGEKLYNRICGLIHAAAFENCETDDIGKELGEYAKMMRLLKSLKDRYIWKPSNEQIEALLKLEEMHVLEHENNQENAHLYMVIKSIKEQLLKLREE